MPELLVDFITSLDGSDAARIREAFVLGDE
jgi:hypothetical protein